MPSGVTDLLLLFGSCSCDLHPPVSALLQTWGDLHLMGSSFTCSEREHAEEAEDAEEADPEDDACGAARGTSGAARAAPQAGDTAITEAPSSLGGF